MAKLQKQLRTCKKGHQYYKTSDCPTCPVCEAEKKPGSGFLSSIAAPARRALQSRKIETLQQLCGFTAAEILAWHGMGPNAFGKLKQALLAEGLDFRE